MLMQVSDVLGTGQQKAGEMGDKAGAHAEGAKKEGKGARPCFPALQGQRRLACCHRLQLTRHITSSVRACASSPLQCCRPVHQPWAGAPAHKRAFIKARLCPHAVHVAAWGVGGSARFLC